MGMQNGFFFYLQFQCMNLFCHGVVLIHTVLSNLTLRVNEGYVAASDKPQFRAQQFRQLCNHFPFFAFQSINSCTAILFINSFTTEFIIIFMV